MYIALEWVHLFPFAMSFRLCGHDLARCVTLKLMYAQYMGKDEYNLSSHMENTSPYFATFANFSQDLWVHTKALQILKTLDTNIFLIYSMCSRRPFTLLIVFAIP